MIAMRFAAAAVLTFLAAGGSQAIESTYAAWSDYRTVGGNHVAAGTWTIDVDIDVVNTINPMSGGLTQVKVFGSDTFDPATIDLATVCFGSASNPLGRSCDVISVNNSGPGVLTIMLHFTTNETGILAGDTHAVLTGKTLDGRSIFGIDTIRTAGGPAPAPARSLRLAPEPEAPTQDAETQERQAPTEPASGGEEQRPVQQETAPDETPSEPTEVPSTDDVPADEQPAIDEPAVSSEQQEAGAAAEADATAVEGDDSSAADGGGS